MKKPKRGKIPTLICGSRGKPSKIIAKGLSHCTRCGDEILKGQECYSIPNVGSGIRSPSRFCLSCFKEILEQTQKDINTLLQ